MLTARVMLSFALVLSGLGLLAVAQDRTKGTGKELSDKEFVHKAAIGGMFEVESSKLAVGRVRTDKVKQFAERMIEDHTKANKELKQLAKDQGFALPERLDAKHQKLMEELREAGDRFERQYVQTQVKAHDEAVELFSTQAKSGRNAELRRWAEKTLPTLREHREMIKRIADTGAKDRPGR